jgi:hypothetical protein
MKQSSEHRRFESAVLKLLQEALGPTASVEMSGAAQQSDVCVSLPGGQVLLIEVKSLDSPRRPDTHADAVVYVLHRATRRLHNEMRRAGHSFVDVSGTVHLALPNILVDRTNLRVQAPGSIVRQSFDPFSDRASLILRTLLESVGRDRTWGIRELATEAGVSPATATRVTRELERHGVQVQRRGRTAAVRLRDPHALFAAWTRAYDWTRNPGAAFAAPMGDADLFLARVKTGWNGPRWALGLQSGAARVAPLSTFSRVHIYVDVPDAQDLIAVGEMQGWEPAEDGNLVLLKPWYRTSVWHGLQRVEGLPVTSTLQLALDLWHYPLRGREQAEHLLETLVLRSR